MEHTFLIDNYVLVLEMKKIKFEKKRKKFLTNPIKGDLLSGRFSNFRIDICHSEKECRCQKLKIGITLNLQCHDDIGTFQFNQIEP